MKASQICDLIRQDKHPPDQVVNTTSRSDNWSRGLSPFFLGPVLLWGGHSSRNVENAWQYSKVYPQHAVDGWPTAEWIEWAKRGWGSTRADRYPMGKGAAPLFSYWDGVRLTYVQARRHVYIPLYRRAVMCSSAWGQLCIEFDRLRHDGETLYLVDFDGYRHRDLGMEYRDVVRCEARKMGHAFVLAMMIEEPERLESTIMSLHDEFDAMERRGIQ